MCVCYKGFKVQNSSEFYIHKHNIADSTDVMCDEVIFF